LGLLITLTLGVLLTSLAADAQQPVKVPRIGFLANSPPSLAPRGYEAFWQGLRELGYVDGQNIAIEYRFAGGHFERFPNFAAELVRLKVDVIVAVVSPAAQAAQAATKTIPIVTVTHADPVGSGLVASLARPGANITGLTSVVIELIAKQLELLKEAVPKVSRVAVISNPANQLVPLQLREADSDARVWGVELQILEARGPNELDRAFAAMTRERIGALLVLGDPLFFQHRTRIADLAAKRRLPAMAWMREFVEAGGLMAYGASIPDLFRRAATYVDKILEGAKPADLPVEQPTKFELVINLKTAKTLGLTIPQSVLMRADEVLR
jgi:putative ABC transport system substrate-binding protein